MITVDIAAGDDDAVPSTVDDDTFRSILGSFPTGVAVVAAIDPSGRPLGLTTSAVTSVSAMPPMIAVCVDQSSRTLPALRAAAGFVVNFVRTGRASLCATFASKADDKFAGVHWTPAPSGHPVLDRDAVAYADCTLERAVDAGDHVLLVGLVRAGGLLEPAGDPLVYFRRRYGQWAASQEHRAS